MPQTQTPPRHLSIGVTAASGATLTGDAIGASLLAPIADVPAHFAERAPVAHAAARFAALGAAIRQQIRQLSTAGLAPSAQTSGIPTILTIGDADRRRVDLRWAQLFSVRDLTANPHPFFKVSNLYGAITWATYMLGERIRLGYVKASETIFETDIVAGGPQWNQLGVQMTDGAITPEGIVALIQASHENFKAKKAYQILTASGISTTSYDTTGTTVTEKVIRTINGAISAIEDDVYNTPGVDASTPTEEEYADATYGLLYNPAPGIEDLVAAALASSYTSPNDNLSRGSVIRPIVPIPTRSVPTGGLYVALPGRLNVFAQHQDLAVRSREDIQIAGVAEARIGQARWKFVRGDSRQVRKALLS